MDCGRRQANTDTFVFHVCMTLTDLVRFRRIRSLLTNLHFLLLLKRHPVEDLGQNRHILLKQHGIRPQHPKLVKIPRKMGQRKEQMSSPDKHGTAFV